MRAAHEDAVAVGVAVGVVALGVWVGVGAAVVLADVGTAVLVAALAELVGAGAAPEVPPVALPVEHAATSEVRTRATGRTARDGIRLRIRRP
jgi:hypothetical protein